MAAVGFVETYGKELVSLAVPLITWAVNTLFKARARLHWSITHQFTYLVAQPLLGPNGHQIAPNQTVNTRSMVLWNVGRETATKVEWVFNWKPLCLNVWPSRHYQEHTQADGRYILVFESLAPGETQGCEILDINRDLPNLVHVRCDQCVAAHEALAPQPTQSKSRRRVSAVLQFAGVALLVYLVIVLAQFLILRTPFGSP